MDNATRRQLLEQAKQIGYTGDIIDVFHNPQILDQFIQEQQQQIQQQPQQQMPVEMPTPPATTPNYKVPQPKQSETKPLVMSNTEVPIQIRKNGGPKEMPFGLPLKEQNIYLLPEYNQPKNSKTGEILPDPQRPNLGMNTGATEYKYTYGSDKGDIDVPSVVSGQYIGDQALNRYMLTGERFKTMHDPGSYSKFYDQIGQLGLMQEKKYGGKKCYTCNSSNLQVLYNKRNYKK